MPPPSRIEQQAVTDALEWLADALIEVRETLGLHGPGSTPAGDEAMKASLAERITYARAYAEVLQRELDVVLRHMRSAT